MEDRQASDRFILLVEEYRLAGWIGLGKLKPPQADDARPDLALARHAIDTLGMLEVKTRGNLSSGEERLLRQILADLRINFADEVKRAEEQGKAEHAKAEKPAKAEEERQTTAGPQGTGGESESPAMADARPSDDSPSPEGGEGGAS